MDFPRLADHEILRRLDPPTGRVPAVLDTDTYNEIDDQFALAYALLSPEHVDLLAVTAAPFHNNRSDGPADGMEKSYEEILRVMDRMGRSPEGLAFRGSTRWMENEDDAVSSQAAERIVELGMQDRKGPLYVLTIGAATNVASALVMEPRLVQRVVVVWLAGQPHDWASAREFNLCGDPRASRVMFNCGVPLVQLPCAQCTELLRTTAPEMERYCRGAGPLGDYLYEIYMEYMGDGWAQSKVIWDIVSVAWLIDASWVKTHVTSSPILTENLTWSIDRRRHPVREGVQCNRDAIFGDLFWKIQPA